MRTSILVNVCKIVIPFIQVFAFYVMIFGHLSPGGGFSGGSILGASFILYRYVYGSEKANETLPYPMLKWIASLSLMCYGLIKGGVFILDFFHIYPFKVLHGVPGTVLSGGFILPLNILVGVIVGITFYLMVILFEEGELDENTNR